MTGAGFLSNWTGQTVGDLFERTHQSMPQNDPGKLSRAQNADVLAYILGANGFPEGKGETGPGHRSLKPIKIDEKK